MKNINLTLQQQMRRRQCMCQQRCRQMHISNCIDEGKVKSYIKDIQQ